ncbi:MAG: zinc-dependent metalloprotease, partial [Acidimicrobiia bacterium]
MSQSAGATVVDPVDWLLARRVARRVAGPDPFSSSYLAESLHTDFEAATLRADELVTDYTGLRGGGPASARVLDRTAWVDANVASMQRLLGPLTNRLGAKLSSGPFASVGRRVAGTEVGVLLGFLARRVIGQYDLLVAGTDDGLVYYVGPNVLALERRYAFRPRDFRLWIAIHEVTHRAQFTGVPWLRGYFLSLVDQALGAVDPDPRRLFDAITRIARDVRAGRNPLDDGGVVALFATPEQRAVLARVQALMSLLEGHGNRVMNELGRVHLEGQKRMARVLEARRSNGGPTALVYRLLGLDAKMRQYATGESFLAAIESDLGPRAVDIAWRGPEWLPT